MLFNIIKTALFEQFCIFLGLSLTRNDLPFLLVIIAYRAAEAGFPEAKHADSRF